MLLYLSYCFTKQEIPIDIPDILLNAEDVITILEQVTWKIKYLKNILFVCSINYVVQQIYHRCL